MVSKATEITSFALGLIESTNFRKWPILLQKWALIRAMAASPLF